jgi:hypothetical protein
VKIKGFCARVGCPLLLPPVASLGFSCPLLFIFDLLCKRVSSLPYIRSTVCGFIYKAE